MFQIPNCHECNVNAHAKISDIFLTVCACSCKTNYRIRKWSDVFLRLRNLLGGSMGGSCVNTCSVHWTVQLSHEHPGGWTLFMACTVQLPNQCLQTNLKFVSNRPTNLSLVLRCRSIKICHFLSNPRVRVLPILTSSPSKWLLSQV